MGPKGSLPPLQEPAVCLYPEPDQSSPCPTTHFLKIHFNINLHSTSLHFTTLHSTSLRLSTLHFFPFKLYPSIQNLYPSTQNSTLYIYIYIYIIYICYMTPCNLIRMDSRFGVTFLPLIHYVSFFTLPSRIRTTVYTKTLMPVKIHGVILKTDCNQNKV